MKVNDLYKNQLFFLLKKYDIRYIVNICLIPLLVGCKSEQYVEKLFPCNSTLKDSYGVTSHVTRKGWDWEINASEITMIGNSGIKTVRADFDYRIIDENFSFNWLDTVVCNLKKNDMGLLGIVTNPYKSTPWANYPAYQSYINSFVEHLGRDVRYWEIINEVDLALKNVDSMDVKYTQLLHFIYTTIKNNNPKNQVLLSGISNVKKGLLERLCQQKAYKYFDIMNFHTYDNPENLLTHFEYIKECMDKYGWKKPVWITELGSHTCMERDKMRTEDYQARTVARYHIISFAYGVDKVFWYNFRSFEKDKSDPESHFGLTHKDLSPKPGLKAYQTFTSMCPTGSSRPKLSIYGNIYVSSWKKPDNTKVWALWTTKDKENIDIQISGNYRLYDYLGNGLDSLSSVSSGVVFIVGKKVKVNLKP